jgi:hypothetical protein
MKLLTIRDDDFSYWTDIEEVEEKYMPFLDNGFYISFGIIPKAVKSYNLGNYNLFFQDFDSSMLITNNYKAVEFIKREISKSRIDILIHGYEHKYYFNTENQSSLLPATKENLDFVRNNNELITFIGEFNNLNYDINYYSTLLTNSIHILKRTFNTNTLVFVPPSNQLCNSALKAIQNKKINLSGIYGKNSFNILSNYLRIYYPLKYNLIFPFVYKNQTNQLSYHSLTTASIFENLIRNLEISSKLNAPFQIATHYWELNSDLLWQLNEITRYAKKLGYISAKLSHILNK